MNAFIRLRLLSLLLLAFLLGGCASTDVVRGRLVYDLRPEKQRSLVFWPKDDVPRYRYLGELVGEPNFVDMSDKTLNPVVTALKWIAGLFDEMPPFLLHRPYQGAVGEKGRVYVVDTGRNAVVVFDPTAPAEEKSERGEGQMLVWELAEKMTPFDGPIAVATVWGNDIAVSDAKLRFVARLDEKGEPVGKIGAGELQRPTGLVFDRSRGLLYVADTVACDIKVYNQSGKLVKTIGSMGKGDGEFNAPTQLALAGGHLYVSDTLNNRIQIFDGEGRYLRQFGQVGLHVGNLTRPKGVAVGDGGIVYVVESYYGYLLAYDERGELLMGFNGSGLRGGDFSLPAGVWTDGQGRLFVADMLNGRVVVFQFLGNDGG